MSEELLLFLDEQNLNSVFDKKEDGRTALHIAAHLNRIDLLKEICEQLGDANPLDKNGQTPFFDALHAGHTDCMIFLGSLGGMLLLPKSVLRAFEGGNYLLSLSEFKAIEDEKIFKEKVLAEEQRRVDAVNVEFDVLADQLGEQSIERDQVCQKALSDCLTLTTSHLNDQQQLETKLGICIEKFKLKWKTSRFAAASPDKLCHSLMQHFPELGIQALEYLQKHFSVILKYQEQDRFYKTTAITTLIICYQDLRFKSLAQILEVEDNLNKTSQTIGSLANEVIDLIRKSMNQYQKYLNKMYKILNRVEPAAFIGLKEHFMAETNPANTKEPDSLSYTFPIFEKYLQWLPSHFEQQHQLFLKYMKEQFLKIPSERSRMIANVEINDCVLRYKKKFMNGLKYAHTEFEKRAMIGLSIALYNKNGIASSFKIYSQMVDIIVKFHAPSPDFPEFEVSEALTRSVVSKLTLTFEEIHQQDRKTQKELKAKERQERSRVAAKDSKTQMEQLRIEEEKQKQIALTEQHRQFFLVNLPKCKDLPLLKKIMGNYNFHHKLETKKFLDLAQNLGFSVEKTDKGFAVYWKGIGEIVHLHREHEHHIDGNVLKGFNKILGCLSLTLKDIEAFELSSSPKAKRQGL